MDMDLDMNMVHMILMPDRMAFITIVLGLMDLIIDW